MKRYTIGALASAVLFTAAVGVGGSAHAQSYPTKPITIIVPYALGGGATFVGQLMAEDWTARLGQRVLVEARGGAGATIGATAVATAPPDGYTLMLTPVAPILN